MKKRKPTSRAPVYECCHTTYTRALLGKDYGWEIITVFWLALSNIINFFK